MTTIPELLALARQARELAEKATPGLWTAGQILGWDPNQSHIPKTRVTDEHDRQIADCFDNTRWTDAECEANAAFIALVRTTVPELAAGVEWLAEQLAECERQLDAAEERECDMHMRIRLGYDKTVADTWRAANVKLEAQLAASQAEVERLNMELRDREIQVEDRGRSFVAVTAQLAAALTAKDEACDIAIDWASKLRDTHNDPQDRTRIAALRAVGGAK